MSNKTVELAILRQVLNNSPAPVKGVPIAISNDGTMWWYLLEDEGFAYKSVEDRMALYTWLSKTAKAAADDYKINVGVARK